MKKVLFTFFAIFALCASMYAQQQPVKILGIGNSFTVDAMEQHLQPIMDSKSKLALMGYPYNGGTTLQEHWQWTFESTTPYDYREWREGVLTKTGPNQSNLVSKIEQEAWDYVLIQTDHAQSGMIESYEPYLTNLIGLVKDHCSNKSVKIGLYMTWSFDASSSNFPKVYKSTNKNQEMYDSICSCVQRIIEAHSADNLFLIPCGTAVQNARTSYKGQNLNRDGYHLNTEYGRYIASLCWAKAICGFDPDEVPYKPEAISDYCANMCRQAVTNAFYSPYDTISLRDEYGKSEDDTKPASESRLERVSFNGMNVPIVDGLYEYTVNINAAYGEAHGDIVDMYSFPISTKAIQNVLDTSGGDIEPCEIYGYFPLNAPASGETLTYINHVNAEDHHVTTYTFHLVGVSESEVVYPISSEEDLKNFAAAVNAGQYGLKAVLTKDIDLSMERTKYWKTPIGTIEHPYTGTFDGQGYTLKNFNIFCKDNAEMLAKPELGLFGAIDGATIRNLNMNTDLEEITLTFKDNASSVTCCGALVGQMSHSTISHCTVAANFNTNMTTACPMGAICGKEVGSMGASTIEYCRVSGTWTISGANYVGGFVGWADNVAITNCISEVRMSLLANKKVYFGGFVGVAKSEANDRYVRLTNCYMAGSVSDDRASHSVSTSQQAYLAAFYGYVYTQRVELNNCHWLENCAPAVNGAYKSGSSSPTATTFPAADLTNGNLVAKLGSAFKQGVSSPVFEGDPNINPEFRGKYTVDKAVTEFGWTAGNVILNVPLGNVTLSTANPSGKSNGKFNNGTQWRVYYLYDNGPITISADNGYWIDHVQFEYTAGSSNGILVNQPGVGQSAIWSSGDTINVKNTQRKWYVGNTSGNEEGWLGFTRFAVTYYKLPTTISLAENMSIAVGSSFHIGEVTPMDAYHVWSSNNESVVSVDQNGLIVAKAAGTATITVTSKNNISHSCVVNVFASDDESFTENFNSIGAIPTMTNNVLNPNNLTCGLDWTLRNVKRDATTVIDGKQGIEMQYRVGTTSNKDKNYIARKDTHDGGVKAVSFQWRAVSAEDSVIFDVDEARNKWTKYHTILPPSAANQEVHTYALKLGDEYKENAYFRIRLANVNSSNVVFGPVTITPYVLFREKNTTINTGDYIGGTVNLHDLLIDNTEEGAITYSIVESGKESVATLADNILTIVGPGKLTVKATWNSNKVTTVDTLTIVQTAPKLSFDAVKNITMNTAPFINAVQGVPACAEGTVTYESSKPRVAKVNSSTGEVTIIGEGTAIITATMPACGIYSQASASYTVKVSEPKNEGRIWEAFTGQLWKTTNMEIEVPGDLGKWNSFQCRRKDTDTMETGKPSIWFNNTGLAYLESQQKIEGGIKRMSFIWLKAFYKGVDPDSAGVHNFSIIVNDGVTTDTVDTVNMAADKYGVEYKYNHNIGVKKNVRLKILNNSLGAMRLDTIRIVPYLYYTRKSDTISLGNTAYTNDGLINNTEDVGTITYSILEPGASSIATINSETGAVTPVGLGTVTVQAAWQGVTTTYQLTIEQCYTENFLQYPNDEWGETQTGERHGDYFDWNVYRAGRLSTYKLHDQSIRATRLQKNDSASLVSKDPIEGGIKRIDFKWVKTLSANPDLLTIAVGGVKDVVEATEAIDLTYGHAFEVKQNAVLKIHNDKGTNTLIGPIHITPYLFYTQKNCTTQLGAHNFVNKELINNTHGEGTIKYTLENNNPVIAVIDSVSGIVTPLATGDVTVKATWSEGAYTTYQLNITANANVETFNSSTQTSASYCSEPTAKQADKATWTYSLGGVKNNFEMFPGQNAIGLRAVEADEYEAGKKSYIESSPIAGGLSRLSFLWNLNGKEGNTKWDIRIFVNGRLVRTLTSADIPVTNVLDTATVVTIDNINEPGKYTIRIENHSTNKAGEIFAAGASKGRFIMDNLELTPYPGVTTLVFSEEDLTNQRIISNEGEVADVQLIRTLYADRYNTFCVPFAVAQDELETYFGEGCKLYAMGNADTDDGITINFNEVTSGGIVAGTPYLLEVALNVVNPTFTNRIITATTAGAVTKGSVTYQGVYCQTLLHASGSPIEYFLASNNVLYRPMVDENMKGLRAYFQVGTSAPIRMVVNQPSTPTELEVQNAQCTMHNAQCTMHNGKFIKDNQLIILRDGKRYNAQGQLLKQ